MLLFERTTDRQIMVTFEYLSDISSKISEVSLSLLGKQLVVFVANDKIPAFKWKWEFCKAIYYCEFDNTQILKDAADEKSGNITYFDFWNNKTIKYIIILERPSNIMDQYFPIDQYLGKRFIPNKRKKFKVINQSSKITTANFEEKI